ncbi:CopG family transcriptional regulator [Dactylosporangium sp. NPDC050588]|uniref:ribbon-helix-helix domain-containing protein n=1 Tax=Dactylosporangium sp. NPDC050588 TaxID=3157211 RepID=UPI0033EE0D32
MHDDLDHAQIAADQEFARAFAAGEVELVYDDSAPVPELPPVGAPVTVVRPVRLPHEVDAAVKRLADQTGTTPSALIRRWIEAALVNETTPDPVAELRYLSAAVQRIAETLDSDRTRNAA